MHEIGAFEAKNRLGALLDRVERGEEIVITRRGKPVAKLVPAGLSFDRESARRAVAGLLEASRGVTLGGLKIKDLIDEGRSFVLDNSVALTWCFEDERTPATAALLVQVGESGALAPGLWPLEALNGLLVAERRGRLDAPRRHRLTGFLRALPIKLDDETASRAWTTTLRLAERFALSTYNAAYLELAQRHRLPLASLDRDLRAAAGALGLDVLGS